jgi:hypothetical protein
MSVKFSNNAKTTLSSGITSSATSIAVADASVFPSISGSEYFYVTFEDLSGNVEIVKVTGVSSNTLTVVRAQESTTARAYASGDKAENRLTAGSLNDVATQADTDTNTTYSAGSGISLSGTTFSNSAPDQTVSLTGAGATTISGTYPNFTVTSTDNNTTYTVGDGGLTQNNFTNALKSKLDGVEASADVTDATNVTAAGALMDSELTAIASVKALNQGVATTDSPAFNNLTLNGTGSVKVPTGTTAQRDSSPAAGMFRFNSTTSQFEGYTSGWGEIGGGGADLNVNTFTGDGSTTAYTISSSPLIANTLIYIDGVYQNKSAYSVANDVITFSAAPASGSVIEVTTATIAEVSTTSTTFVVTQLTGNGSTTAFTLAAQTVENNTSVYFDGVYQSKANYSVSGATITFSTAPENGVAIEVMSSEGVTLSIGTPDNNSVVTAKIADNAVTQAKIADDAVGADQLASSSVVTASVVDDAVTQAKIANDAVGSDQLATNAVVTASLANDAVTAAKIASEPVAVGITTVVASANMTATVNTHVYVDTAGRTITLPASPTIGQRVLVTVGNFADTVIGRNGSNIMSSASDMTLDQIHLSLQFIYTNATVGWAMS